MENHNTKILNYVHENAEMGVQSISKVLECIEDSDFEVALSRQYEKYHAFQKEAEEALQRHNVEIKHVPKMTTFMSDMMIEFKTMRNCCSSKVAEMMLQGSTMGIINATKIIKQNKNADQDVLDLANRLLDFETKQFDNLKQFL